MTETTTRKKEKDPIMKYGDEQYLRIPIKTSMIGKDDNIVEIATDYVTKHLQEGDVVFISEKAVAITQGRAYPVKDIKPRKLAVFLSNYVTKTPAGIGLGIPETMEMALKECGVLRILFAAIIGAIGKIFGIRGLFYRIAGPKAASIDGPTHGTIPPYDTYVVLGPINPDSVAKEISQALDHKVAIVDINDLGGVILGTSHRDMDKQSLVAILKDNPLGQGGQQTPMGIIRKQLEVANA